MGEEVIYEPTPVLTKVTALRATLNEICERSYFIRAFLDIIITALFLLLGGDTRPDELSSPPKLRHHRAPGSFPEIICHFLQRQMHF
jgi:hypothetical protein